MITAYHFNYVLSGIKRQIPISKSLHILKISKPFFYTNLSLSQRRLLDEHKLLYGYVSEGCINRALTLRNIRFEEGYISMMSLCIK